MAITASIRTTDATGVDPWQYQSLASKTVYSIAHEALELMYKYSTPPEPIAYAVWFAYVSKASEALVLRINQQLQRDGQISAREILEMHQTYIEDGYVEATRQNLGLELEYTLKSASSLIGKSVNKNRGFSETLKISATKIDKVDSIDELQGLITQMAAENLEMSRATEELGQELTISQTHIAKLNQKLEELQHLSMRDPLTGISNRRAFDTRLQKEIALENTPKFPLCLALIDLDHFKRVNDNLGHQVGDEILKRIANILDENTPDGAMVARYGGEEFAIILTSMKMVDAHNLMVKVSHMIPNDRLLAEMLGPELGVITASIGLAHCKSARSASELIAGADKQLYAAKKAGRNCVKSDVFG